MNEAGLRNEEESQRAEDSLRQTLFTYPKPRSPETLRGLGALLRLPAGQELEALHDAGGHSHDSCALALGV